MRVTVIGTGYVGTVTGACLAYCGHRVTCVDTDAQKIEKLRRGEMPIYEPCLEELLQLAAARGGIDFTTELAAPAAESDVIFIAVGTPPLETGEANLCYLEAAARSIGAAMDDSRFRVVVNKSTVPVGSGNLVETLVREGIRDAHPGDRKHPLRRGQQSGVPAGRQRHRRFAVSGPHRAWRRRKSARCRCCANCTAAGGAEL
jgi:UDPglucose 6-dehydrogenase